ncbi:MAG: hypothetical protein ACOX4I_02700 [Anaerovoracaceae bacterium]|jgi:hypothetical protein
MREGAGQNLDTNRILKGAIDVLVAASSCSHPALKQVSSLEITIDGPKSYRFFHYATENIGKKGTGRAE